MLSRNLRRARPYYPELIINGTFDSGIEDWEDVSTGVSMFLHNPSPPYSASLYSFEADYGAMQQALYTLTVGHTYRFSMQVLAAGRAVKYTLGTAESGDDIKAITFVDIGATGEYEWTATDTDLWVFIRSTSAGEGGSWSFVDDVSLKRIS